MYNACRVSCLMVKKGNILVLCFVMMTGIFCVIIVMDCFCYSDEMEFLERERITEISPFLMVMKWKILVV